MDIRHIQAPGPGWRLDQQAAISQFPRTIGTQSSQHVPVDTAATGEQRRFEMISASRRP